MANKKTRTKDETVGREYWIPCSDCDRPTRHSVVSSYDIVDMDLQEETTFRFENQIIECRGCRELSFRRNYTYTEDVKMDDDGNEVLVDHPEIYPARIAGRKKLRGYYFLPLDIEGIYNETHTALSNGLNTLAGVGIRAIIEVVCNDKDAKGQSLKDKIDDLVNMGVLTKEGAEILHHLRVMGNKAAHEVEPHAKEDLDTAFDVVEHLLQGVYVLKFKAKRFQKEDSHQQKP